jgi:Fic family protein
VSEKALIAFVRESNMIEGILRDPTDAEIAATERFMALFQVHATTLGDFQSVVAPGKPLRECEGMDVRVGNYIAPPGGPNIVRRLQAICRRANSGEHPWKVHCAFETLHPYLDGNGRTGRALWAWQMYGRGHNPFALGFLHRFYYQTLEHSGGRK